MIIFWRVLLIFNLAIIGFVIGAFMGALSISDEDSGLASGGIVFTYGLVTAIVLSLGAFFASLKSSMKLIRKLCLYCLLITIILISALVYRAESLSSNINQSETLGRSSSSETNTITKEIRMLPVLAKHASAP